MPKQYQLDDEDERLPGSLVERIEAADAKVAAARRRRWAVGGAIVLAVLAAGGLGWHFLGAAPQPTAADGGPAVPEHQRTGQLANPWGSGRPSTSAEDATAAASAAQAALNASAAGVRAAASRGPVPPTREALRDALARLRGGGLQATDFVKTALQGGDTATLVAAWMVERQCRLVVHWRQVSEWRSRVDAGRGPAPGAPAGGRATAPAASNYTPSAARCDPMPDVAALETTLELAGFPYTGENAVELTRRPIDLALAFAVADPLLVAEVVEATPGEALAQQMQAWGVDARDLERPEVVRAALWLASCRTTGGLHAACREHPALWQACIQNGLCEVRSLDDLLLRTMPPEALGTSERLSRFIAPKLGK